MKPGDLLGGADYAAGGAPMGQDPDFMAPDVTPVPAFDGNERRPASSSKPSRPAAAPVHRGGGKLYEAPPPPPRHDGLCEEVAGAVPAWAPAVVADLAAGLLGTASLDERPDPHIVGSGDRAHHLALINGVAVPVPRRPSADPLMRLPGARPTSRATCERRCGRDGFCDPSSPYGCGGEYCQGFEGRLY